MKTVSTWVISMRGASGNFARIESTSCRAEAISAFLAVLEMARLGLVRLHQTKAGSVLLYRTAKELDIEALEGIHG